MIQYQAIDRKLFLQMLRNLLEPEFTVFQSMSSLPVNCL